MARTLGIFILLISCVNNNEKNNVLGNWKSNQGEQGPKFQTELLIDEDTFNIFSEEVNDIIFSGYYRLTKDEILLLDKSKKEVEFSFRYQISDKSLIISADEQNTTYTKILKGKTMGGYINGVLTKEEYIDNFNKRKSVP